MKIKQQTVTSHPSGTDKSYVYSETFFDIAGNITEFRKYKRGKVEVWEKFIFNKQNKLTEKLIAKGNSYKLEDYKFQTVEFKGLGDEEVEEINEKGQKVISTFYFNGGIKSRKFFNEKNICFEENEFKKGSLTKKAVYNSDGLLLEVRNFRADGTPLNYTVNSYNEKNKLCSSKSISGTNNVTHNRIFKYNDEGLLIEDIDHPVDPNNAYADVIGSSNSYSHKYFYNFNKLKETENLYLCGELIMAYKYSYNFWQD
jgi:hypothetical protein